VASNYTVTGQKSISDLVCKRAQMLSYFIDLCDHSPLEDDVLLRSFSSCQILEPALPYSLQLVDSIASAHGLPNKTALVQIWHRNT
jgi:hypothetical protein